MKRMYGLLCILLCFCMVLSLSACNGGGEKSDGTEATTEAPEEKAPETAEELWTRVDEVMTAVPSYEYKSVMQFTYYYMGMKFDTSSIGNGIFCELEDDYYIYSDDRMDMVCTEMSISRTQERMEAYSDGKMYIYNSTGDAAQRFCSAITYEEYAEESTGILDDFDLLDCTGKSFEVAEDGSYTMSFSGYTKKAVDNFLESGGIDEDDLGAAILDLELTVSADSEFHVTKMLFNLIFDVEEDDTMAPVITMEIEYSGFGVTEPNYDQLKTEEYTEIDDARIFGDISEQLEEFTQAKSGEFVSDSSQTNIIFGEEESFYEKNTVSFSEENGGIIYEIEMESSEGDGSIRYKNGTQNVVYLGEEYSQPQTDSEAREFVASLLDVEYDSARISDVEKVEEGVYVFTVEHPDDAYYKSYFQSIGMEYQSMTQTFTVTMDGEELLKIANDSVLYGVYNDVASSEPVEVKIHMGVDFTQMHKNEIKA